MTLPALTLTDLTIGQLDKVMKQMGGFGGPFGQRMAARKALQRYHLAGGTGHIDPITRMFYGRDGLIANATKTPTPNAAYLRRMDARAAKRK